MTSTVARGTMPLAGHVREARVRATRAAVALVIGCIAGYLLANPILDLLRSPIEQVALDRVASLNYDTITGAFDLKVRVAMFAGIVLASPVWLFELFAYVTPGLTRKEKRYTFGFTAVAVPLFLVGCYFGLRIFPRMVELLAGISSDEDTTILTASYYVDFVLKVVIALGISFVLPVLVVMLNFMGILSARRIRRSWRVIVVVIVLFSALVTPSADVLSMFLVAIPMTALFGIALLITHLHDRRAAKRARMAQAAVGIGKESAPCSA
ncbi:twin-arginine translocase subunit TatC [Millisia brevis]|uniref:twin-arginine translocase subunit TatC n=1 Tax=Millisia brevis TaxID=264148 RepID=UPI00082D50BB|nr:twin-arginine translocase subunit TatC [Millisia brevis]